MTNIKQAMIMAKYAEVAARRVDHWSDHFSYWVTVEFQVYLEVSPFFDSVLKYRHIGDAK